MAAQAGITRRRLAAAASAALTSALAAGAAGTAASAASRAPAPGWRQTRSVSVRGWPSTELTSVAAPARGDAWALGDSYNGNSASGPSTLWHWDGSGWARIIPPASYAAVLAAEPAGAAVTASGRDAWVIGPSHWLRFDGRSWSDGEVPGGTSAAVKDAKALGPHDVWLFGSAGYRAYAAHFDGARWTRTPLPQTGADYTVSQASAVSARDIWAGIVYAGTGAGSGEIVHWDGRRWDAVPLPASFGGQRFAPLAVYARSASDVWAGGTVPSGKTGTASGLAHWDGHRWTTAVLGPDTAVEPSDITADGQGGMWIMPGLSSTPWKLWHCAGRRCATVALPGEPLLAQLAHVPGTATVWAVGSSAVPSGTPGVIYRYGPASR